MNYDVIIIGSGVSGLLTAIELAESGTRCCLLDKGQAGRESSWAGGGILLPLYPWNYPAAVTALASWSIRHYPDYFARLENETGISPQWTTSGHLILDRNERDNGKLSDPITQWAKASDSEVTAIDRKELASIEPGLDDGFHNAMWLPGVGQVRNPRLNRALQHRTRQLDITLLENTEATRLITNGHTVSGVSTRHEQLAADKVLITAGAWSALSLGVDTRLPDVEPVKGQMIQFQTEPGTIRRISLYQGHYVIPRLDGKILVGSTLEYTGYDKSTDSDAANTLLKAATQMYPLLRDRPIINHWAGLRPGNERQTPYICPHPEIENLFFNTGHFRNGIVLGLASARLCTDLILGRTPDLNPSDYAMAGI